MGVILLRLWTLTVFYGEEYRRQAENNRTRVVTLKPPRGILYDRNGTPLVSNIPSFDISIVPEDVGQEKDVVARLASILGLDPDDVEERIADLKLRRRYEPVKIKENADWRDVTRVEARRIDLPGVVVEVENRRRYLYDLLGANLVGYIKVIEQLKEEPRAFYPGRPVRHRAPVRQVPGTAGE
jgi:penicillin-binding protein 2